MSDNAETPILIPVEEAATRLGVTVATIRSWILYRKISSHKLGGRRLIHQDEIARLVRESHVPAIQGFAREVSA